LIASAVTATYRKGDRSVRIGIPREEQPGETLVAATPKTTAKLISLGYEVIVQAGVGAAAKFPDEA